MKAKIIGASPLFPWHLGDDVAVTQLTHIEGKIHLIHINETAFSFEITHTVFKSTKLVDLIGFLANGNSVGRIAIQLQYE